MQPELTLHLDPWLRLRAREGSAEAIESVRFTETVDYDRAVVGGTGFLRMSGDDWQAIGAPESVTVTVAGAKGTMFHVEHDADDGERRCRGCGNSYNVDDHGGAEQDNGYCVTATCLLNAPLEQ